MIEARWYEHDDPIALARAVAAEVGTIIGQALAARGEAVIALPGGTSPRPIFERLAATRLPWARVTIVPGDERLVEPGDPLSNVALLKRYFAPSGAQVVPLAIGPAADYRAAGVMADARLAHLRWPLDLVWLGMGIDGHTASILPGPDLEAALDAPRGCRAIGLMPDPLPAEAAVARVTLTRSAIVSARTTLLTFAGQAKHAVLQAAIAEGDASAYPVGRVLAAVDRPIIHWSPA